MIKDLKKILLIGTQDDKATFFQKVQEAGCVEFIRETKKESHSELAQTLIKALKILKKEPECLPANPTLDVEPQDVLNLKQTIEKSEESVRLTKAEIARIAPFGDFSLEEIAQLEESSGYHFQFFCMKQARYKDEGADPKLIYVGSEYDMAYFVTFSQEKCSFPKLIEMHFEKSLFQLKEDLETLKGKIADSHTALRDLTAAIDIFRDQLVDELNCYNLGAAKESTHSHFEGALFSAEAYVPKNKLETLETLAEEMAIHFEEVKINKGEKIPTYMENQGLNAVGEDLVHIYDTPAPSDKDPSGWVFWAFILFFAMIVSDGGYGFLYLTLGLVLKAKFKKGKASLKRLSTLVLAIGIGCTIWGISTSSYFGVSLKPTNPLSKISMIHLLAEKKADYHIAMKDDVYSQWVETIPALKDVDSGEMFLEKGVVIEDGRTSYIVMSKFSDNLLLEFSLVVGILHIILSLMRYLRRDIANVGWITFMIGGYLFFPSILDATTMVHFLGFLTKPQSREIGIQMIQFGVGFAVIAALIQHRLSGLGEITKVVQVFSDVLSYLRLYALGLAGMIMADTFNMMGLKMSFFFGLLVIIVGHTINISLGVMGGVIHGLRLNFLEWYHYSFDGGGKIFNPLKIIKRRTL